MNATAWRNAAVLVTGARGFIASRLCQRLLEAGAVVYGTSRQSNPTLAPSVRWITDNLTDLDHVRKSIAAVTPSTIFHLAGHVTGSQLLKEVQPTLIANLVSTVNLLTVAAESRDCRVVLTGSMQEPQPHGSAPCSPYAASKLASTAYAQMFHALYHLPTVVARPMMVYGPGQWDLSKFLPYLIDALLKGDRPRLASGERELDWVFVDDVVEGLMTVAVSSATDGQEIELGSGQLTSVRTVAHTVCRLAGSDLTPVFGALPDRRLETPRVARVVETRALTGWSATTSLDDGLSRTIDWFRKRADSSLP